MRLHSLLRVVALAVFLLAGRAMAEPGNVLSASLSASNQITFTCQFAVVKLDLLDAHVARLRMGASGYAGSGAWYTLTGLRDESLLEILLASHPCFVDKPSAGRAASRMPDANASRTQWSTCFFKICSSTARSAERAAWICVRMSMQ